MNIKKQTVKDRYGNVTTYEFDTPPQVDPTKILQSMMEKGGVPSMPQGIPDFSQMQRVPENSAYQNDMLGQHPGAPKGTDTVPAWLTPGEFVVNAEAVREFGPEIKAMNDTGRAIQKAQGGTVPEYKSYGGAVPEYHEDGGVAGSHLGGRGFVDDEEESLLRDNIYNYALQGKITAETLDTLGDLRPEHKAVAMKGINDRYASANPGVNDAAVPEIVDGSIPTQVEVPGYTPQYGVNRDPKYAEIIKSYAPTGDETSISDVLGFMKTGNTTEELSDNKVSIPDTQGPDDVPMELSGIDPRVQFAKDEASRGITTDEFGVGVLPGEGSRATTEAKDRNLAEITGGAVGFADDVEKVRAEQQAQSKPSETKTATTKTATESITDATKNNLVKQLTGFDAVDVDTSGVTDEQAEAARKEAEAEAERKKNEGKGEESFFEKAQGYFMKALDGVLDSDTLAETALLYAGSRLLGYDHAGSLNFAGKAYASQIQNKMKKADAATLSGKYTKSSVKEYRASGDLEALKLKPVPAKRTDSGSVYYSDNDNKPVTLYKYKDSQGNEFVGDKSGSPVELTSYHQDEARVAGTTKFGKANQDNITFVEKGLSRVEVGDEGKFKIPLSNRQIAEQAVAWANEHGIEASTLNETALNGAMEAARSSGSKVNSIVPYLNEMLLKKRSGLSEVLDDTNSGAMNQLATALSNTLTAAEKRPTAVNKSKLLKVIAGKFASLTEEDKALFKKYAVDNKDIKDNAFSFFGKILMNTDLISTITINEDQQKAIAIINKLNDAAAKQ